MSGGGGGGGRGKNHLQNYKGFHTSQNNKHNYSKPFLKEYISMIFFVVGVQSISTRAILSKYKYLGINFVCKGHLGAPRIWGGGHVPPRPPVATPLLRAVIKYGIVRNILHNDNHPSKVAWTQGTCNKNEQILSSFTSSKSDTVCYFMKSKPKAVCWEEYFSFIWWSRHFFFVKAWTYTSPW